MQINKNSWKSEETSLTPTLKPEIVDWLDNLGFEELIFDKDSGLMVGPNEDIHGYPTNRTVG